MTMVSSHDHCKSALDIFFTENRIKPTFVTPATLDQLGTEKGAYILLILLDGNTETKIKSLQNPSFTKGLYIYAGNANGGGGIKSRLKRHLQRDKKIHWHIDHLTTKAARVTAFALPGQNECDLIAALVQNDAFTFPLKGFGSSDCSICTSHLMQYTG